MAPDPPQQPPAAAPRGAPWAPCPTLPYGAAPLLLALLLLAPPAGGCLQCDVGQRHIPARLARLCARYRQLHGRPGCPPRPWGAESWGAFALDETRMDALTEKAHRVLQLLELNSTVSDLSSFWAWLRRLNLLQYTKQGGSAWTTNCSSCRKEEVPCWSPETCYSGHGRLRDSVSLVCLLSASSLLVGLLTCALEFRFRPLPQ
ncbi:sperm-egg fusion protein TMEM95 isoform X2 [Carettochelys insculpta]|uniref:sperm-egg fusion protein TMEM95 isoform X2 n=1 Tax=Carettochelys insculpta TaxID=44489 RepID=UPI003EB71AFB